jgi:predicted Zn-dependent peptidase
MKVVRGQRLEVGKLFLLTLIVLSFVFTSFGQAGKPSVADQAALVTEFEVNGLKVLVKRRVNSQTVAAGLFIRGGARNITSANAGIENLMLEAAREGSKNFPREMLRRELSKTGSTIGSDTAHDYTALSLATTRQNFDRSWEIFTDIILNPAFTAENIAAARERIATGLREQETDNDNFLQILQGRIIYANHPYANDVTGTLDNISRFSASDLSNYHKKVMQTSQLLLVVVGDIDAKDLEKRIASTLGKLPKGDYKEQAYPAIDFSKPTLDVTQRTLPTNYVQGVFSAPSLNNPDYYAMRMAMTILQSLVFNEVRNKRQLSYAPNAELGTLSANTANIYVTAVDANTAVSVMLDQINLLKTRTLNPEIISSISEHYLTNYYLAQETNAAQAGELAKYELIGGGWRNSFEFLNRVRQVTTSDVQTVSNKYMKNIRFIVVGNPSAVKREIFLQTE